MRIDKSLSKGLKGSKCDGSTITSPISGLLLGLVYIITLPFLGLCSSIMLVGYFTEQRVVRFGRRAVQIIVRA